MSEQSTIPPATEEASSRVIPIELSMAGYNAYYHHCDTYHGRSNYAVCQHTIDAVLERRMQLRSECPAAIEAGTCPALKMRQAERDAGRALYFIDRREILARLSAEVAAPSEVVKFGKRSGGSLGFQTQPASEESMQEFNNRLKTANQVQTVAPKRSEDDSIINAGLAGRNLLGEVIDSIMKEESTE